MTAWDSAYRRATAAGLTVYVYDAFGQLAAEYSTAGSSAPCTTCYLSYDYLGSVRMVTDQSGNVAARHDYLPFGEEISAGSAGRNGQYRASDSTSQRFTGQYRDFESGQDWFGARYYGSALGRWTTTDPEQASASLFEPQSWNLYSYVWNRPLAYIDPDGRNPLLVTAAVGAGVGALAGAGFELIGQWSNQGYSFDNINWSKVGTAALGGAIAGGITGGTLGLGSALGISYTAVQSSLINAGANVIGGEMQLDADVALGNSPAPTIAQRVVSDAIDGVTGAIGGVQGGEIAEKIYPLPNVRQEIAVLQFAHQRSTRALRIQAAQQAASAQATKNVAVSGSVAAFSTSLSTWWSQTIWNGVSSWWSQWWFSHPTGSGSGCVSVTDSASGSQFGGCQ